MEVNGHALTAREAKWMAHVAEDVVPHLLGSRDDRLDVASRAAWWSLKEGDFDVANAPAYSNCNSAGGDHLIGPVATCGAGRAWQVGLAGVQVPGHKVADLEALAQQLFPDATAEDVLAAAAAEAGFDPDSDTAQAIVASTGTLRASWLLRNSVVGFTVVERSEVVPECIHGSKSWCFGHGWDETRWYAPTRAGAMTAMADIRALLDQLSPQ